MQSSPVKQEALCYADSLMDLLDLSEHATVSVLKREGNLVITNTCPHYKASRKGRERVCIISKKRCPVVTEAVEKYFMSDA
ncbi:MAG: hypothetical protein ABIG30_01855 [Candidatus Aenigmatarchaeota archaeon]